MTGFPDDEVGFPRTGFPDPVLWYTVSDGERVVKHANDAYYDIVAESEDVSGDPLEARLPTQLPIGRVRQRLDCQEEYRARVRYEAGAEPRDFLFRVVPPSPQARVHGYVIYTDVTTSNSSDRLRSQSERLEQVVRFLSHDLRNLLDIADKRLQAAQQTGEAVHFEKVAYVHDRIEALAEDVRTIARRGETPDERACVDLDELVGDIWETVEIAPASLIIADDLPAVEADPAQLRTLFENLFQNAIEHAGPDVVVEVGPLADGFYVADDGPGIPDEHRDQIFDAGFSTADTTGLGLVIVKRIAEAHGWDISIASSGSGGARFEVTQY